jgi:hypothetical protein
VVLDRAASAEFFSDGVDAVDAGDDRQDVVIGRT